MSTPARQLFAMHEQVDLPITVLRTFNSTRIHRQILHRFPFVRWPSGYPCEPVNGYLLGSAPGVTGDTLKTYAAELSPLIRYCASQGIGFQELDDTHFCSFSESLQTERSVNRPSGRARCNNTVRRILSRAIAFLHWYSVHFLSCSEAPLVGEMASAPRIVVRRHHNRHGSRQGRPGACPQNLSADRCRSRLARFACWSNLTASPRISVLTSSRRLLIDITGTFASGLRTQTDLPSVGIRRHPRSAPRK